MAVYQRFIAELDQNHQHLTDQVSEIDVSDPEDLRATMPEQGSDILAHFGEDQFLQRLQVYKSHIAEWRGRYPRLIGVDLRYNGEVPLEMAKDASGTYSAVVSESGDTAGPAIKTTPAVTTPKTGTTKATPAKATTVKTSSANAKSAQAKKNAKLKAAKAAHEKAARAKAAQITHSPSQEKQGQ
jgi:cell division protein FtsQ